jgi:proteasome accessory factor C
MVDNAAIRALRTMDLIPYILENPGVSISSLATRFSVTQKQIENDLQLIFMCGLPGYTPYELIDIVFEDGIVSVIDPQVLDKPRRFNKSELIVIALGLQILIEINKSNPVQLEKLQSLSRKISKLGSSNSITFNPVETKSVFLGQITKAISERNHLNIEYNSLIKDKKTNRVVDPQRIYFLNGNLYLSAFDLEARSDRVFKVDLIEDCKIVDYKDHVNISEPAKSFEVVLDVRKSHRSFIERNSSVISASKELGDRFEVHIQISNLEWLKRSILSNAPGISISSPNLLANELLESANTVLALYQA